MRITKSKGVTRTERLLAGLCERSFLKLWSYPNPYKDDGRELCDLLAVFENQVFIFFDRKNELVNKPGKDPQVVWTRWKRNVVDAQMKTAHGAERYIRSGRPVFLDSKCQVPFPINIHLEQMVVHKIIVAHGAKEACKKSSDSNVYGSLAICYGKNQTEPPFPFVIHVDKLDPVHVFDSHNLPIVLNELDTVVDFSEYLNAKLQAIAALDLLMYCGEEDLLAHYYLNFDDARKQHFIGTRDATVNCVMVGEGEWKDFVELDLYKNTKRANQVSYLWDEVIQITCQNALTGKLLGNADLLRGRSAVHEMAKEPRFSRRALSEWISQAIRDFPQSTKGLTRHVSFMPSYYPAKGYVFLQLRVSEAIHSQPDYHLKRQTLLEIACGAAKNKFPNLRTIVGIAIDAPKFVHENSEDFILMDCEKWSEEQRAYYEESNKGWDFFRSPTLKQKYRRVTEFLLPQTVRRQALSHIKAGRNDPCQCGSGKKYKKCCGK
jgi:hypothetical protein